MNEVDARRRLLTLINAHWTTQAISVAAQLRLPELLRDGAKCPDVLARETGSHMPSLVRLLRALTSIDVLSEADDRYSLSAVGAMLLPPGASGSLAAWAVFCGTRSWETWGHLAESVRSGQRFRKQATTHHGFTLLDNDPEAALLFNRAMADLTRPVAAAVAQSVDFSSMNVVVDIGGGSGELIATILAAFPSLRGIVLDLAHATAAANDRLTAAGVEDRSRVVTGNFFDAIPADADGYLMKSVLHDWNDASAIAILRNCRQAMAPHAKLFIIERIAPERFSDSSADQDVARSDLNMLVATGGRERTDGQYRALVDAAGLRATRWIATRSRYSVLEAVAR